MARNEEVRYSCDVCGNTSIAQRVIHPDGRGVNYVRPDGWGNVFMRIQLGADQITQKKDICSEECMDQAIEELRDRAYPEG